MKYQRNIVFALTFVLLVITTVIAQDNCNEVFVESWKTGNEKIATQKFEIKFSSSNKEFEIVVVADSGKQYKLFVRYIPIIEEKLSETGKTTESWVVELREIISAKDDILGENLLRYEGIGGGGDNFPRKDLVGYLYLKDRSKIKKGDIYLIDGSFYYPSKFVRIVKTDGFYVMVQIKDFQFNAVDKHKVDFLNVSIKLTNDDPSNCSCQK